MGQRVEYFFFLTDLTLAPILRPPPHLQHSHLPQPLSAQSSPLLSISTFQLRRELQRNKARKAAGPEGISFRVLKACVDQLCGVVQHIFNLSLRLETVPALWKTSCVVPYSPAGGRRSCLSAQDQGRWQLTVDDGSVTITTYDIVPTSVLCRICSKCQVHVKTPTRVTRCVYRRIYGTCTLWLKAYQKHTCSLTVMNRNQNYMYSVIYIL